MGWGALIGLSIVLVGLGAACRPWADRFRLTRRRQALLAKYRDEAIVEKILSRTLWEGETAEQLLDSLGTPVDVDHKASKTRRTEIWKYAPDGANRYRLRIQLDDDVVVGWEHR